MSYAMTVTSKGTATIPVEVRRELGLKPGSRISYNRDSRTRQFYLRRLVDMDELRELNRQALKVAGTAQKQYKSGDGFTAHALDKLGN